MKLIIEIPNEDYNFVKRQVVDGITNPLKICIAHGTPLDDVLDKIRAELHATAEMHDDGDYYLRDEWIDEIFDKYRNEVNHEADN